METCKRMVFHTPFPIESEATSASAIRPARMLQAFEDLGFEVIQITGYARERKKRFSEVREQIAAGWRPDFVYSEAATVPSSFTEPRHFPLVLRLERRIFRYFHEKEIPIGVFYRDVYWSFPDYVARVGKPVAAVMRMLYRKEICTLNRYADVVFLPTLGMADFIPGLRVPRFVALPPGSDVVNHAPVAKNGPLHLIYVGAVGGDHYDLGEFIHGVSGRPGLNLTVCTPRAQALAARAAFPELSSMNVRVVSASGAELDALYSDAQIASLLLAPQEYRTFAAPMKLYEYLGRGKPVLASEGTHAAEIVREYDAGWIVPFDSEAIAAKLTHLLSHREEVQEKAANAQKAASENTWSVRAETVAQTLAAPDLIDSPGLHVLKLPSWYPTGQSDIHGSFFREQAEALAASGFQVGVLALTPSPIYAPSKSDSKALRISTEGPLGVVRGSVVKYIPMQRWLNVKLSRRRLLEAWNLYVDAYGKPDVLHAHSLYPGAFFAHELSREFDVPFVYTEHRSLEHMPARSALAKRIERRVVAKASSRQAVSRGHADHLRNRFGGLTWEYTPNLLAPASYRRVRLDPGRGRHGSFRFGHLSNLDPVKRVDLLLEAFAEVYRKDNTVRLLIGGDGPEFTRLLALADSLHLSDAVTFLGHLSRQEVLGFYSKIDAFVLPSSSETMGVVQLEALAAGVPVISTRTWGGTTVIAGGRDGILVDVDDESQLIEAMRSVRVEPQTLEDRLARAERCIRRFGVESFVERYRGIYKRAVRDRKNEDVSDAD